MPREVTLQHISYTIENGFGTSLWFNSWNSNRPFCTFADHPLISHSSLGKDANDGDILSSSGWNLQVANYYDFHVWNWLILMFAHLLLVIFVSMGRKQIRIYSSNAPSLSGLCKLFFIKDVIYLRLHGLAGING